MSLPNKLFLTIILFACSVLYADTVKNNIIELNKKFYSELSALMPIERDGFLEKFRNEIVQGRARVESVGSIARYRRRFRIAAVDPDAANLNIIFNIFTDNEEYLSLLQKGDTFEFKGQLALLTPTDTNRESYIFDVILEEGALNITSQ